MFGLFVKSLMLQCLFMRDLNFHRTNVHPLTNCERRQLVAILFKHLIDAGTFNSRLYSTIVLFLARNSQLDKSEAFTYCAILKALNNSPDTHTVFLQRSVNVVIIALQQRFSVQFSMEYF